MSTPARSHSPPTPPASSEPSAKRVRLTSPALDLEPATNPVASTSALPYGTGLHLAPMVRIGTLPTRLLCKSSIRSLEYGAELVWGPEIVDKAIIGATREVDPRTGTIKFTKKGRSIFECHPLEKPRLIFQLGSADPDLAVEAAKIVQADVAGIGLNCGCPKPFSLSGGMGAALLKVPDKLCSILRALVKETTVPIDVKIRLLPEQATTLELVSQLIDTGVSALTVHCRTQEMRSSEPALLERLKEIVELVKPKGIPVIANGDCIAAGDRARIEEITGVSSIMIARGAESNPSCFSPHGHADPTTVVLPLYIRVAMATDNNYANSKYCMNAISLTASSSAPSKERRSELKQTLNKAKTYQDACNIFDLDYATLKKDRLEDLLPLWTERRKNTLVLQPEAVAEAL
ncbi:tRNA-dihydrouridine synthase 2, partial [Phenoliferia sp. Uapishka_3]